MDDNRQSAASRGYNRRWQKYREGFLRKHPFCADHDKRGQVVVGSVVDHITPHRGDTKLFWDPNNHQTLCKPCHDRHKQLLERTGVVLGCDVDGVPIDPNHHWATG